jgi:hypothetical protein
MYIYDIIYIYIYIYIYMLAALTRCPIDAEIDRLQASPAVKKPKVSHDIALGEALESVELSWRIWKHSRVEARKLAVGQFISTVQAWPPVDSWSPTFFQIVGLCSDGAEAYFYKCLQVLPLPEIPEPVLILLDDVMTCFRNQCEKKFQMERHLPKNHTRS